jgi:hypothetical protein
MREISVTEQRYQSVLAVIQEHVLLIGIYRGGLPRYPSGRCRRLGHAEFVVSATPSKEAHYRRNEGEDTGDPQGLPEWSDGRIGTLSAVIDGLASTRASGATVGLRDRAGIGAE